MDFGCDIVGFFCKLFAVVFFMVIVLAILSVSTLITKDVTQKKANHNKVEFIKICLEADNSLDNCISAVKEIK